MGSCSQVLYHVGMRGVSWKGEERREWIPVSGEMYISMALRRPDIPIPKIMSADPIIPPEISRMVTCRAVAVRNSLCRFISRKLISPDKKEAHNCFNRKHGKHA